VNIFHLLAYLVELYMLLLIARALLSWFSASGNPTLDSINKAL